MTTATDENYDRLRIVREQLGDVKPFEMKFQKPKRYRRLRILNYTRGAYRVMADVDNSNTLTVRVFPKDIEPIELPED